MTTPTTPPTGNGGLGANSGSTTAAASTTIFLQGAQGRNGTEREPAGWLIVHGASRAQRPPCWVPAYFTHAATVDKHAGVRLPDIVAAGLGSLTEAELLAEIALAISNAFGAFWFEGRS